MAERKKDTSEKNAVGEAERNSELHFVGMEREGSGQPCEEQGLPYNRSEGDSRVEFVAPPQLGLILVTGVLHSSILAPEYCPLS